ncbi:MAG: response regulator transcription factor, partial [Phenylobacterium sp.]|uniref:response regulator n=1 Tax=Phenylobacterium sp. TaxID=1871053 RepID=UPI0027328B38
MIRVTIVEDDDKIRNNLIDLIEGSEGFRCVAAYSNAEEALQDIPTKSPNIVLMDINLPGMDGIECTRRLKIKMPELLIVMLTVYEDANKIFRSLQAGAVGYLLKLTQPEDILSAL